MKFRAFYNGKMYKVVQLDYRIPNMVALTDETTDYFNILLDDVILMQSIGVKDIDDNEIFVGDIILIPDSYDEYGMNAGEAYEVYFAYGGFRMKPKRFPLTT